MPRTVDLCTEVRRIRSTTVTDERNSHLLCNTLFLNKFILFKYCAEMKITLSDGHLGIFIDAYSQSYPQNLWVSYFLFPSKTLSAYVNTLSSIDAQAIELA